MVLFIQKVDIINFSIPISEMGACNLGDDFGQTIFDQVSGFFTLPFGIKYKGQISGSKTPI